MNDPDRQIDDELRAAGERWRSSRPTPDGGVDPALLITPRAQEPRAGRLLASLAGVALLAVVGAAVLLVFVSRPPDHAVSIASPSPTPTATMPGSSPTVAPSPTVSPRPTKPAPSPNPAEVACSAILDNIPMVRVQSGKATVAAAYEVTGEQMTRYFIAALNHSDMGNGADWWNSATKIVDMCVFDGDFEAKTPGPPGHDTNATRVLVVIDGSDAFPAFPWAFCFSNMSSCGIPTTDPATMSQPTPTDASPTNSSTPSPQATPMDGYTRFPGHNFSFDYPSNWRFILGYDHCGHDGPTLLAAVGIGEFATGWHYDGNTLICGPPHWTVPDNGIVLVYRIDAMMGPQPFPSLGPGEEWVDVGGRSAVFSQTADSMTWHFPGAPEYVEVQWGPALAVQAPDLIAKVIASWHWDQ